MSTKNRLAQALREARAPSQMIDRALLGEYDDFESNSATPIMRLVRDCQVNGLNDLAKRAMDGEFDATKEEAEAWFKREGRNLIT